jgi:hypothetical protein
VSKSLTSSRDVIQAFGKGVFIRLDKLHEQVADKVYNEIWLETWARAANRTDQVWGILRSQVWDDE